MQGGDGLAWIRVRWRDRKTPSPTAAAATRRCRMPSSLFIVERRQDSIHGGQRLRTPLSNGRKTDTNCRSQVPKLQTRSVCSYTRSTSRPYLHQSVPPSHLHPATLSLLPPPSLAPPRSPSSALSAVESRPLSLDCLHLQRIAKREGERRGKCKGRKGGRREGRREGIAAARLSSGRHHRFVPHPSVPPRH